MKKIFIASVFSFYLLIAIAGSRGPDNEVNINDGWVENNTPHIKSSKLTSIWPINIWDLLWTGEEMIVVGENGARFYPETNKWLTMPKWPLPSKTLFPYYRAVWTGKEVIVWGSNNCLSKNITYGAVYDPNKDKWRLLENIPTKTRYGYSMIWTGQEVLIWGGGEDFSFSGVEPRNDGYSYNPETNKWEIIEKAPTLKGRFGHISVWTGEKMIVFGGLTEYTKNKYSYITSNDGAIYDPQNKVWRPIAKAPTQGMLAQFTSLDTMYYYNGIWTGNEMIVLGANEKKEWIGSRYNPSNDRWQNISLPDIKPRALFAALWTGKEMIIWGGAEAAMGTVTGAGANYFFDGARYNPETNSWSSIPPFMKIRSLIEKRYRNSSFAELHMYLFQTTQAVWSGQEIITLDGRFRP